MTLLDHGALVKEYATQFSEARTELEEIAKHLTKDKGQGVRDLLNQIVELLQRIETAAAARKLEVEVARSIARDFETIGARWRELEQYFIDQVLYDDYIYKTDEERAKHSSKALQTIRNQILVVLDDAGAMYGVAQEWRRAAKCFNTVVQAQKVEVSPLAPVQAMIREYRCYEELGEMQRVIELGRAIHKALNNPVTELLTTEKSMLEEAVEYFRKTAMTAITNRQADPDINIPLGSVYLWCEAEALNLITDPQDDLPLSRFQALAEFFEQVGKEELTKPTPSLQRFVSSYMEGAYAYLRINRDIKGLSVSQAQQQSFELTQYLADFILTLIERLGYQQVRIVKDTSKAMKGIIAILNLIRRGHEGHQVFSQLSEEAGDMLVKAQQRGEQSLIDLATLFRWLFQGAGNSLLVISAKLISDIYCVALVDDIFDVGSKTEIRQTINEIIEQSEEEDLLDFFIEAEVEFDDVVDLFLSLGLFWIAAICKQNQGQLRQNLSILEVSIPPEVLPEQPKAVEEGEKELADTPFWGAAPSRDFTTAAELYSQAFRVRRGIDEDIEAETEKTWIPHRDPEDLKRRAAHSYRLAGIAHLQEGNIEQGGRELIRAKNAYELLDRHREAINCLDVWVRQLVATISADDGGGARPTESRLKEVLEVCDELVGLYAIKRTSKDTVNDILGIIEFLQDQVGIENWTLPVFLRSIEYTQEALRIAIKLETPENAIEMLHFLREELSIFLGSDFAIGVFPNFEPEITVYFEAETPVKLAIINTSAREHSDLTIRPIRVLPHISPSASQPWKASRDPSQVSMKNFYVGCNDEAFELKGVPIQNKPADAFGPTRSLHATQLQPSPSVEVETFSELKGVHPWLGVMWTGDYNGMSIGTLKGATEEPTDENSLISSIDDLTTAAFFTVFTKAAREGNIIPGQIFPVTFGIFKRTSLEPIATQVIYFKIASRPKLLKAETNWVGDFEEKWEESFSIIFEEGAKLPRYVPRFAPEYELKDYVNPKLLTPTIAMGSEAVEVSKYLRSVPYRFNLRYYGDRERKTGQNFEVNNTIVLEVPFPGPVGGEYEFLRVHTPSRFMTDEELQLPRLRNGVNFQEVFFGTVFIGDSKIDGEYYIYRLWICFEPGEKSPAPGANYRQGWTNHRLDIFLEPKTWQPRLLVTDYYVQLEDGRGEWVEALFTFKAASSTLFGIRRLVANFHREVTPDTLHGQLDSEIRRALQSIGIDEKTALKVTGFNLGQRLGFIDLIRLSWARNSRDGPVIYKPPRAHLFRDYWSQRYEHGLYREDWRGETAINQFEMRTNDRSGGKSKYVRGFGERDFPHEIGIIPREGERCDLRITPPDESTEEIFIRNIVNPRKIELWTRPHVSFSRRFNWFAKHFGRPPKIHTASLYFYSTRRKLNPYYKGTVRRKDRWVHYPEPNFWNGKQWVPIPEELHEELRPENLSYGINTWLEADAYWIYRYVWYWPLEITLPLPHDDWERADIWVNARTGNIEWITSDYHWRELWYENAAKIRGVNPIIDFLFNWNTPEPLTVKDGAQVHQSIQPYFHESKQIGEFADQLPWMFARFRQSAEHLHKLHESFWGRHKVKIVYGLLVFFIFVLLYFFVLEPLFFPFLPP